MLEKSVEGKSFILIIPNDFKIYEIFEFNIQKIGEMHIYIHRCCEEM